MAIKIKQNFIDVKELIKSLGHDELVRSADAYWENIDVKSEQCYRPFHTLSGAHDLRNLSILFQLTSFRKNQAVLDFGCGAGWLTNALADCGLNVTGIDISRNAVNLSNKFRQIREPRCIGTASSLHFDGSVLPFESEKFDRIVCFDSFHHVADQNSTLKEFHRVLKPGGRAVFIEPAPGHSLSEAAQYEMRNFNVIENDIDVEAISLHAISHGFAMPFCYFYFDASFIAPIWSHKNKIYGRISALMHNIKNLIHGNPNLPGQYFFILKPGLEKITSVDRDMNSATISMSRKQCIFEENVVKVILELDIENNGESIWLHTQGIAGKVNLGVLLLDLTGHVVNRDFMRFDLSVIDIYPGMSLKKRIEFEISREQATSARFCIDLVAEECGWFSQSNAPDALQFEI